MSISLTGYIEYSPYPAYPDDYDCFAKVNIYPGKNPDYLTLFYKENKGFPDRVGIWTKIDLYDELHLRQEDGYWMTVQELEEIRFKYHDILIEQKVDVNSDEWMIPLKTTIAAMKSLENETSRPTRFLYYFT